MILFINLIVNGLIIGMFFALIAVGLSLIFGILKIVNFAHGEFYMVGAYAYTLPALMLGWSPWLTLLLSAAVAAALGVVVERTLIRPLYSGHIQSSTIGDEYSIIVTFGLSLLLMNLAA